MSVPKPAIGSFSIGRVGAKFRAFVWRDVPENVPVGRPLFVFDADTLEEATSEMLRAIRGERPWP
jgi:hypothetical protein